MELINEIRVNPLTKTIAIISTVRRFRPKEYGPKPQRIECPFCPGNEELTPPATAVLVRKDGKREVLRDSDTVRIRGWRARIFPNKYPALSRDPRPRVDPEAMEAYGYHEVLVESPRHVADIHEVPDEDLVDALWLAFYRMQELLEDPRIRCVVMIKNRGSLAGASIVHTHMQIFALPIVPPRIAREVETFELEYKPLCRFIARELEYGKRIVYRGKHFVAMAISAPRLPYEVWVAPLSHRPTPFGTGDEELLELAKVLKSIVRVYVEVLKFDSYNMWFHIAPRDAKDFHWHIEIAPSLPTWGGLEKSSDAYIIEVPPEEAAEILAKGFTQR